MVIFTNFINRLFTPIMKCIYTLLISRDTFRTNIKSKMELSATKDNGKSLTFVTEIPTLDSTGVLDTPQMFLENMLKLL